MKKFNLVMLTAMVMGTMNFVGAMEGLGEKVDSKETTPVEPQGGKSGWEDEFSDAEGPGCSIVPMRGAHALFEGDPDGYVANKRAIERHYTVKLEYGHTGLDNEMRKCISDALSSAPSEDDQVRGVVFMGVDGVVLSSFELARTYDFEPIEGTSDATENDIFYTHRMKAQDSAMPAGKEFCKNCKSMKDSGHVIVLISGRRDWKPGLRDATVKNLEEQGILFDELYLMPDQCNSDKLGDQALSFGDWVKWVRGEVCNRLDLPVVATVGEVDEFFDGEDLGVKIKLPEYLCMYKSVK